MTPHHITTPLLLTAALTLTAPLAMPRTATLQAAVQVRTADAYKAMLNVFAYDRDGRLLKSGTATFISARGEAVGQYATLAGAARAEAVDFKGNRYEVSRILGANRDQDLVRFTLAGVKKCDFLSLTTTACAEGTHLRLLHYTTSKKDLMPEVTVTRQEAYADYCYYTISAANDSSNFALPLVDDGGNLVAIVQRNASKNARTACAIDARFISGLRITALSAISSDLRAIGIAKALPADTKEALNYIYMLPQSDTTAVNTAYADFIAAHPDRPEGFLGRAALAATAKRFAQTDADIATALQKASKEATDSLTAADAVHYQYSDILFRSLAEKADSALLSQQGWTYAKALSEAEQAYAIRPLTLYVMQQAKCLFADAQYAKAYEKFRSTTSDPGFATSDTYYWAARSLELSGGDAKEVIALLDSAVNAIQQPVNARSAQYYLERSQRLLRDGRYRDAVMDYNEYEKAIGPRNLNERFYYLRYEAEMEAHMYQQAIDDIRTAISSARQPLPYRLEEAFALLRVGEFQQAITAATALLKDLPESPDCHKVIGISYGELGKKALAQQHLQKARALGDTTVDQFIQKYK